MTATKSIDVTGDREIEVTPDEDASVLIGATVATVDRSHRFAQLRAGKTYRFYTGATDTKISHLARNSDKVASWRLEKNRQVRENLRPKGDK